jgi:hypothetical protein
MKAVKLFQYAYLAFAVLFIYDAYSNYAIETIDAAGVITETPNWSRVYISLGFAALAIFMYFFRKKFNKKFEDKNNTK